MRLPVDKHTEELSSLYHAADSRIQRLIRDAVSAGIDPITGELRRVGTKNFYERQLAEVRKVLVELQTDAIPKATALVGTAYVQGATYVDEALGTSGAFSGVHREAVNVLADNMANGLNEAASTVGRQAEDVFRSIGLKESAIGILEGTTRKEVTRSMIANIVHEGATSFRDKAGRRWTLGAYSSMVARTTTREAVSVGTANRLIENGHDLVTISKHAHDNDECSQYEGKTFSLSGGDSTYAELDRMPPFHPNCVHVLTPAAATFEQFEKAVGSADARDDRKLTPPDDPFDASAARVRSTIDEFDLPASKQYSIDRLAPNGLDDPELDLPWSSSGETRRQRIESLVAEARATDIDYTMRVGAHIEQEVSSLIDVERSRLETVIAEAKAEEQRLDALLSKTREEALRSPIGSPERERFNEAANGVGGIGSQWSEAIQRVWDHQKQLGDVEASTRLSLLRRVRPGYGDGELKVLRKSKVSGMIQNQARFLPKEWIDASSRAGGVSTKAIKGRAHYSKFDEQIIVRAGDNSTALHELGHRIEHVRPSVRFSENEFYTRRTAGEEKKRLRDVQPGHGYSEREVTREDGFTDPYMGKDYGGEFYELLTMGLEGVFYKRHRLTPKTVRRELTLAEKKEIDDLVERSIIPDRVPASVRNTGDLGDVEAWIRQNATTVQGGDTEYVSWIMGLLAIG